MAKKIETPLVALTKIAGSQLALARAIGVNQSLISKWSTRSTGLRKKGHLPSRYNEILLVWARSQKIAHATVAAHLDMHTCPLCEQELPTGMAINTRILGRLGRGDRAIGRVRKQLGTG